LLSQFLRPYTGYGDINQYMFSGNSNYNSLQVSLNRRFASGLFFGLAYTWSKCMNTTDGNDQIRFDIALRVLLPLWRIGQFWSPAFRQFAGRRIFAAENSGDQIS